MSFPENGSLDSIYEYCRGKMTLSDDASRDVDQLWLHGPTNWGAEAALYQAIAEKRPDLAFECGFRCCEHSYRIIHVDKPADYDGDE